MKEAGQILNEILSERKTANPSYSLRAFARDLGLSAPQLSNVMNGHRGLSPQMAEAVSSSLSMESKQKELFLESLKANFAPRKADRLVAKAKLQDLKVSLEEKHLDLDLFKAVSSWHHFALVELIKITKKSENNIAWFAARLGIAENEVTLSLGRLERLGLIRNEKGIYKVNQDTVIADQGIPTEAIRKFHKQLLERAIQALAFQSSDERYGYSSAMPVKVKSVDRARKIIQKFRTDFAKEVSDHEGGEEIYGFCLQFFRLTQKNNMENSDEI